MNPQKRGDRLLLFLPVDSSGELGMTDQGVGNTLEYLRQTDGFTIHDALGGTAIGVWRYDE